MGQLFSEKEQLAQLIVEKSDGNKTKFARTIGITQPALSQWISGRSLIDVRRLLRTFPDLSAEWLLRGEGEMLKPLPAAQIVGGIHGNATGVNVSGNVSINAPTGANPAADDAHTAALKAEIEVLKAKLTAAEELLKAKDLIIELLQKRN